MGSAVGPNGRPLSSDSLTNYAASPQSLNPDCYTASSHPPSIIIIINEFHRDASLKENFRAAEINNVRFYRYNSHYWYTITLLDLLKHWITSDIGGAFSNLLDQFVTWHKVKNRNLGSVTGQR